jgi:hypothetical protein
MAIGQELLNVPMGEMIYSMASAIARSQLELDHASIETAEMMGGLKTIMRPDGTVGFTDSRVFFGHEYMTIAAAMVTQGGPENPAVERLVATETITYKKYTAPATAGTLETLAANVGASQDIALTATSLADYQENAQLLSDRIKELREDIDETLAANAAANVTAKRAALQVLTDLEEENRRSVARTLERQVQIPTRVSLLELGFAPVFYAFVDTIIEVKIAITITQENSSTTNTETTGRSVQGNFAFRGIPFLRARMNRTREVQTSQANGSYTTRYSHTAEGSSLLRTKLSPVPTPAILEERIRGMMAADQARKAALLGLLTQAGTA